jgi:hypothetical protein
VALLSLWSNCCRLPIPGTLDENPWAYFVEGAWRRVTLSAGSWRDTWCIMMRRNGVFSCLAVTKKQLIPRRDQRRQILATKAEERHEVLHLIRILPLKFEPKHGC